MTNEVLNWIVNYGLGNVLSVFIAFALWRILIFVLRENSKREERLAGLVEKNIEGLRESINNLNKISSYEREEHQQIIKLSERILDRISEKLV